MRQQTEAQARRANLREWARSLQDSEISRLLGEDRKTRTPAEIQALRVVEQERNVLKMRAIDAGRK